MPPWATFALSIKNLKAGSPPDADLGFDQEADYPERLQRPFPRPPVSRARTFDKALRYRLLQPTALVAAVERLRLDYSMWGSAPSSAVTAR